MNRRAIALPALLLSAIILMLPMSTDATLLWGHPYVMLYDRDNASLNYNTGVVFMWNGP